MSDIRVQRYGISVAPLSANVRFVRKRPICPQTSDFFSFFCLWLGVKFGDAVTDVTIVTAFFKTLIYTWSVRVMI